MAKTGGLKIGCYSGHRAHLRDFELRMHSRRIVSWLSGLTHS
jgi:hypothetical protein